jgi:hypothetical protein
MPMKVATIRRWEVTIAFLLLALTFVIGLWTLSRQISSDRAERSTRIRLIQQTAEDSCTSRHLLAQAILKQGAVIRGAEQRAIDQATAIQKQINDGKATDPYPPGEFSRAIDNARQLVRDLDAARRFVLRADCTAVAVIPNH